MNVKVGASETPYPTVYRLIYEMENRRDLAGILRIKLNNKFFGLRKMGKIENSGIRNEFAKGRG